MQKHILTLNLHKFVVITPLTPRYAKVIKNAKNTLPKINPNFHKNNPHVLLKETQVFNHKETPNDHHL